MELERIIDEIFSRKMTSFEGVVDIKDVKVSLKATLNFGQQRELLMVNQFTVSKSNVALNATYVVDIINDKKNEVIMNFETLVSYMFFGVEKVAKKVVPQGELQGE